jgi:hypothetical protein
MKKTIAAVFALSVTACSGTADFSSTPPSENVLRLKSAHGYFEISRSNVTKVVVTMEGAPNPNGPSQDVVEEYDGEQAQKILTPIALNKPEDDGGTPASTIAGNIQITFDNGTPVQSLDILGDERTLEDPNYPTVLYTSSMKLDADWMKTAEGH